MMSMTRTIIPNNLFPSFNHWSSLQREDHQKLSLLEGELRRLSASYEPGRLCLPERPILHKT